MSKRKRAQVTEEKVVWWKAKHGREPMRALRECDLPGCEKVHDHNGGYCCAEHCQEHREMKRKK